MSTGVTIHWHDKQVQAAALETMRKRLPVVGEYLASTIRENVSESTRASGPSLPGQFPHADEGNFRKSVGWEMVGSGDAVRVGSASRVGYFLEVGTRKMAPRPWLRRTFLEERGRLQKIMAKRTLKLGKG